MSSLGVHGLPVRFSWKGQIHVVMRTRGPERIETAWWRGPTVRRDYYIFETNRRRDDSGCFVVFKSEHGFFMEHMDDVNAVVYVSLCG